MPKTRVTTVNLNQEIYDGFKATYPWCFSRFVTRALYLAVTDRKFFERVYFCKLGDE